jgi:2-keto-3-deoxy-L-rhamnonate aldolase RhmA
MKKNMTKQKIKAGQPAFGALLKMTSPIAVELCAYAGFDFVLLDGEHGSLDVGTCEELVRAAEAAEITPLVRVQGLDPSEIARYLDCGVMGIQIPGVSSKEQAVEAVRYCKYFPQGARTVAKVRAAGYGVREPMSHYIAWANSETMIVVMVEDVEGVRNLEEILTVQDIDVVCFGLFDLAHSMGLADQNHAQVQELVERLVAMVLDSDKALGVPGDDPALATRYLSEGALYLAASTEGILAQGATDYLRRLRGEDK